MTRKLYLIGSLRNPKIGEFANFIEEETSWKVFDEWKSAGEVADDSWRDHQKERGRTYLEALEGPAAENVFQFDKRHIDSSDAVVLLAPAGKSGHLELGYAIGQGKPGFYILEDPERWDVMLKFCTGIFVDWGKFADALNALKEELQYMKDEQDEKYEYYLAQYYAELGEDM